MRKILTESFPVLTIVSIVELLAGILLELRSETLITLPILLVFIPPLNNLGGSFGSILSSRISTALSLGDIEPRFARNEHLEENIIGIIIVGLISSIYLGVVVYIVGYLTGIPSFPITTSILFGVLSGLLLTTPIVGVSVAVAFISWNRGLDPDNVSTPIITAIADALGILCIMLIMKVLGF
jgi:mgtE-like transporter